MLRQEISPNLSVLTERSSKSVKLGNANYTFDTSHGQAAHRDSLSIAQEPAYQSSIAPSCRSRISTRLDCLHSVNYSWTFGYLTRSCAPSQ